MKAFAEQDFPAAVESFKFAAERGHTKARFQLGKCYYEGTGVEKDDAKAVEWLRLAAYGDPRAKELLERVEREMFARAWEERCE
jgi:TPR repeat protein